MEMMCVLTSERHSAKDGRQRQEPRHLLDPIGLTVFFRTSDKGQTGGGHHSHCCPCDMSAGASQGSDMMRRIKEDRMKFQEAMDGAKAVSTAGGKDLLGQVVHNSHVPPLRCKSWMQLQLSMVHSKRGRGREFVACLPLCFCMFLYVYASCGRLFCVLEKGTAWHGGTQTVRQEEGWKFKDSQRISVWVKQNR
jgi:hypothetical protein